MILSGCVVAPGEAGSSEGVRFGVDCSDNRRAQASRIVDSMLTLEQHMVDLTDLRDIAKAGAQQRPGGCGAGCAAMYVERHGPPRLDGRPPEIAVFESYWRRASVRIYEIVGCCKVLVPTLRNRGIVFMDEIAQPGGLQEACS